MDARVFWTVLIGVAASLLAATLLALLTGGSTLSLVGWTIFFESMQLPIIAAARRGEVDPCTAWLLRRFAPKGGGV